MYKDTSDACMVHSRNGSDPKRCKRILVACSRHAPDIRTTFLSCISLVLTL